MTETEWMTCTNPELMVAFLRGKVSDRKLRLFAIACCRNIWDLVDDERSRLAVETSERYVEGLVGRAELARVHTLAKTVLDEEFEHFEEFCRSEDAFAHSAARSAAADTAAEPFQAYRVASQASTARVLATGSHVLEEMRAAKEAENRFQCNLLRDLFGNPFCPVTIDLGERGPEIVALAETIYDHCSFERLPELAQMLQDAGCRVDSVLNHCRRPSEHVRGCWVVDLLLGKS